MKKAKPTIFHILINNRNSLSPVKASSESTGNLELEMKGER